MTCTICNHKDRTSIENELLCRQWGAEDFTLESIADKFSVPIRDLQVHALMHIPVQTITGDTTSIAQKINMAEADILRQTAANYFITLQNLGMKLNKLMVEDEGAGLVRISKPIVDLYLGAGSEIRNSVDSIVKMNQAINGEDHSGLNAIASLVTTLRGNGPGESND